MRTSQIVELIDSLGGVVRTRVLTASGASFRDIAAAVEGGSVSRLRESVYETLRFDYALVIHEWHTVQAAILARVQNLGVTTGG